MPKAVRQQVSQGHTIAWILAVLKIAKKLVRSQKRSGTYTGLCAAFRMAVYEALPDDTTSTRYERIRDSLDRLMRRHCKPTTPDCIYLWGLPSKKTVPLRLNALDTLIAKVQEGDIAMKAKRTY